MFLAALKLICVLTWIVALLALVALWQLLYPIYKEWHRDQKA